MKSLFKGILILIFLSMGWEKSYAQFNYVNNPSFEVYDSLPIYYPDSTLYVHNYFAKDWFIPVSCGIFWYRNELLNTMDTASGYPISVYGIPQNPWDYSWPVNGHAFVTMDLFVISGISDGFRTYIESKLLAPLVADRNYCLSFYITLYDSAKISIDEIGARLSIDTLKHYDNDEIDSCYIFANPQIISPQGEYFCTRNKWYEISGIYHASGGEQFITIGNFKGPGLTNYIFVPNCGNFYATTAAYEIDMITLYECDPNPAVAFAGNDTSICSGDSVRLGVPDTVTGYSYAWTPSTGMNDSSASNPLVSPATTTTYVLQQSYYSSVITTDEVMVTVLDCNPVTPDTISANTIFIPNIFTPNEDGNNDIFYIRGPNISSMDLTIYNRWGLAVFHSTTPESGWDGRFKGMDGAEGVYFYSATIIFKDQSSVQRQGSITLLR